MKKLSILIIITLFSFNSYAEKKLEHLFEEWHVITNVKDGEKICYIASLAVEEEGNVSRVTDPYLLVSKFEKRKPEVSVSSGFNYKAGSDVKFMIKEKIFLLNKIKDDIAWANSNSLDSEIVQAMKAGVMLEVKSTSQDGKYAIESYSLKGFTSAFNKMLSLCSVKSPEVKEKVEEDAVEKIKVEPNEVTNEPSDNAKLSKDSNNKKQDINDKGKATIVPVNN